jgi:hypothetical protein
MGRLNEAARVDTSASINPSMLIGLPYPNLLDGADRGKLGSFGGYLYHREVKGRMVQYYLIPLAISFTNPVWSPENIFLDLNSAGCIIKLNLLKSGNGSASYF